jgi:hypothetical protein
MPKSASAVAVDYANFLANDLADTDSPKLRKAAESPRRTTGTGLTRSIVQRMSLHLASETGRGFLRLRKRQRKSHPKRMKLKHLWREDYFGPE